MFTVDPYKASATTRRLGYRETVTFMNVPIDVSLILPARNEAANIANAISKASEVLSDYNFEIIVVDDDSPDGTADIVRQIAARNFRVRCLHRIGRRGLASACIEGALAASGRVIAIMDADLQHDEGILPELVSSIIDSRADLAIGTRYVEHGGMGDLSEDRAAKSEFATALASRFLKADLTDPMSGFFAVSAERFRKAIPNMTGRGFKILLDFVFADKGELRIHEVPFVFRSRQEGESKLDSANAVQFLMMLYDRAFGHIIPSRFVLFVAVGTLGVLVHMAVLFLIYQILGAGFLFGQACAVLVALTYNFFLNNMLTFRDVRLKGWAMIRGWLSFALVCGLGAIANVGVAAYLFQQTGIMWSLSALAGILVGSVWNFVMSSRFTWGRL